MRTRASRGSRRAGAADLPLSLFAVGLVLLLPGFAASALGQSIYPSFEGWRSNPDGTYTLVFGYYSAFADAVRIPAGENNGFVFAGTAEAPEDRGQPVLFLPGRQRNVCRMVVPADFAGNLQWRVRHEGETAETTERGGLDPLYRLEEIGSAYRSTRDLDTSVAAKWRCLNRAPSVAAARALAAVAGEPIELRGFVSDDGLPRGGGLSLRWRLIAGDAGAVTLADPEAETTEATFDRAGDYRLELSASDSELEASTEVVVTVSAPP